MRNRATFLCGDEERHCDVPPTMTVLEWLRGPAGLRGTKEGCAEGDCGACTVILGEPDGEAMRYRPVCACILFVPALDGRQLLTVEHLAGADGSLHPVQRALVERHASQCGFCTPGFVMSLFALHHATEPVDRASASEALAGNLCRCTGYRPILDAALDTPAPAADRFAQAACATARRLRGLPDTPLSLPGYAAPRTLAEAVRLRAERPDAVLLAGGTDVALRVTKERRMLADIIALDRVVELSRIATDGDTIGIGAGVPYQDALPRLAAEWPQLGGMLRRLGSRQIRHRGTIGGNLGTASPIGDMAPVLLALDARLVLASLGGERVVPLDAFFTGYRQTVLRADEIITRVEIPRAFPGDVLHVSKVSKRAEEDISSVCAAFRLRLEGGRVAELRAGLGGLAATPLHAVALERAVAGRAWDADTVGLGAAALDAMIAPIDDMRASARYRRLVARNLLRRLWLETSGATVRTRVAA